MDEARFQVAECIGAKPEEMIFMSGGTETINYVIKGAFFNAQKNNWGKRIIISCVEHVAVLESCKYFNCIIYVDFFKRITELK